MDLKTTTIEGVTYAVVQDGKPVYIDAGKEIAFDAVSTVATISRLNGEAKSHREGKEAAEGRLKAFEGIADPAAAIEALKTVGNLDQKKLIDAGEVEKVKAEAIKAVEERYAPVVAERDKLTAELHSEKIGGAFNRSKVIADKFAIPADLVQARFGPNFKLEDGKVVAFDQNGAKLYSKSSPGNLADFDEALELLVEAYPYKESILKGQIKAGGGAHNSGGQGSGQDLSGLSPVERMNAARAAK